MTETDCSCSNLLRAAMMFMRMASVSISSSCTTTRMYVFFVSSSSTAVKVGVCMTVAANWRLLREQDNLKALINSEVRS